MAQEVQTKNVTQVKFFFSFTPDVLADVFTVGERRLVKLHGYRGVIDPDAWEIIDDDDVEKRYGVDLDATSQADRVETVNVGKFFRPNGGSVAKILTIVVDHLAIGIIDEKVTVLGESVEDVVKGIAKKLEDRSVIDAFVEALEEMKKNVTKR